MVKVRAFLNAFRDGHTYDLGRNRWLWFGILWGIPVPILSLALDVHLVEVPGRGPFDAIWEHPVHVFFLIHPILFGLVFGVMGTVRKRLEERNRLLIRELEGMAMTDPLTGLNNRRFLMKELETRLHRSRRSRGPLCTLMFDVDDFKAINERQGHLAGDVALQKIAGALSEVARAGDVLGRYGGDEFILIAEGDRASVVSLIERAGAEVSAKTGFGVSVGVGEWPEDGDSVEALLNAADRRLRRLKEKRHETTRALAG